MQIEYFRKEKELAKLLAKDGSFGDIECMYEIAEAIEQLMKKCFEE